MISDQMRDELLAFLKERDWEHPPYGGLPILSTSIALEAAELMEHIRRTADQGCRPACSSHRATRSHSRGDRGCCHSADRTLPRPAPGHDPGAGVAHDLSPAEAGQAVDMEEAVRRKLLKMFHPAQRERRQVPRGEGAGRGEEVLRRLNCYP